MEIRCGLFRELGVLWFVECWRSHIDVRIQLLARHAALETRGISVMCVLKEFGKLENAEDLAGLAI